MDGCAVVLPLRHAAARTPALLAGEGKRSRFGAGPLQACNAIQGTIPNLASLPYQSVNKCTETNRPGSNAPQNLVALSSSIVRNTAKFCHLAILTICSRAIAWEWGNGRIADV